MGPVSSERDRARGSDTHLKILQLICSAFVGSLFLHVGVAYSLVHRTGFEPQLDDTSTIVPEIISLVGVVLILVAPLVKAVLRRGLERREEKSETVWRQTFSVATIVAFAMRESVGVLGFVVTYLAADLTWCMAYGTLALIAMLLDFPTEARRAEWCDKARRVVPDQRDLR